MSFIDLCGLDNMHRPISYVSHCLKCAMSTKVFLYY